MTDLRIDYSDLRGLVDEGAKQKESSERRRTRVRGLPLRALRVAVIGFALALAPFMLLIRGGVFAYREWGIGTWPALLFSAAASALLLGLYAWFATHRAGAGPRVRKLVPRIAAGVGLAYVAYGLVFIASENVKSDDVQAGYAQVHPLLRIAASSLVLVDPAAVITDTGRTADDYWLMGLPVNEASLHFTQASGYVHALDLRTTGRPEWRNRAVEIGFWVLGFHSLRHVGTADHLHVSLRPPG